jgi:surface carbohydrate biosynthesis protein (TIGR04326 family)
MSGTQSNSDCPTLLVWDAEGQPPQGPWIPVLWRAFKSIGGQDEYSIPDLVEKNADELRKQYLAWIYELGNAPVDGIRLVDRLALRPGFSFWWMTLPAVVSYGESTVVYSAVRLLALEKLARELDAKKIVLASNDKSLIRATRSWCGNTSMDFEAKVLRRKSGGDSLVNRLISFLPHRIRAAAFFLQYLVQRWPAGKVAKFSDQVNGNTITFVDYLSHLIPKDLATGKFGSLYWTGLVEALEHRRAGVNWLHYYIKHDAVPTARHANQLLSQFNRNSNGCQHHSSLDNALCWSTVKGAIRDYCQISHATFRLFQLRHGFYAPDSNVDFWPIFERDWHRSTIGAAAILNCLFLNLFERTLKYLPPQKIGVYLLENQPWEMAFIHAWRTAGHGRLVGAPHATVLYWDLRYFSDPRCYERHNKNDMPLPDQVALNGTAAISTFRAGGFPEEKMVEVEALRYLYLQDHAPTISPASTKKADQPLCVLVLTDYFPAVTQKQMQWLADAARSLPVDTHFLVKPHPSSPVIKDDYPALNFEVSESPLNDLLSECEVAYTGNITSAAMDAYCVGVPVISALNGETFNMSPLRDFADKTFVTGPNELARALRQFQKRTSPINTNYFCIDKSLPRWRQLLELDSAHRRQAPQKI